MQEQSDIVQILFKLRYLASKLESQILEYWINYELEGYPDDVEVPEYRLLEVSYAGNFAGPGGTYIKNAPIPPYLIDKHADASWTRYPMRQSVALVDQHLRLPKDERLSVGLNADNLLLVLQGRIYPGYSCMSISAIVNPVSLSNLRNTVRIKIFDLTLKLEKSLPMAAEISVGPSAEKPTADESKSISNITKQIFYGDVASIQTGTKSSAVLQVYKGDIETVIQELKKAGVTPEDSAEFANILASDSPESPIQPFGDKAEEWIKEKLPKILEGGWGISLNVATNVLTEVAKKFYGL